MGALEGRLELVLLRGWSGDKLPVDKTKVNISIPLFYDAIFDWHAEKTLHCNIREIR